MNRDKFLKITELRRDGYSFKEIANRLGIPLTMAWKYGRNVRMLDDKRYQRQRTEGVGALKGAYRNSEEKKALEEGERKQLKEQSEIERLYKELIYHQMEAGEELGLFFESLLTDENSVLCFGLISMDEGGILIPVDREKILSQFRGNKEKGEENEIRIPFEELPQSIKNYAQKVAEEKGVSIADMLKSKSVKNYLLSMLK